MKKAPGETSGPFALGMSMFEEPAVLLTFLWWLSPLAFAPFARRLGLTRLVGGFVISALCLVGVALLLADADRPVQSMQATGKSYQDTYYVISTARFLQPFTWIYLGLTGLGLIVGGIGKHRVLSRLTEAALLLAHSATGLTIVREVLTLLTMPRRYADYPGWFRRINSVDLVSAHLMQIAIMILLAILVVGVVSRLWKA